MVLGQLGSHCKTMKLDPYLTLFPKLTENDRWPKYKSWNHKLFEENIGVNLHDLGFGSGFLNMILKAQVTKQKIDKFDTSKCKTFVRQGALSWEQKGNIQKGRNICKSYFSFSIYPEYIEKNLLQCNIKKPHTIKKWVKGGPWVD